MGGVEPGLVEFLNGAIATRVRHATKALVVLHVHQLYIVVGHVVKLN